MNNTNMQYQSTSVFELSSLKVGDFLCDVNGRAWQVQANDTGIPILAAYTDLTERTKYGWSLMVPVTTPEQESIDQARRDKDAYRAENS